MREATRYRPARDRFKIYILDEAHQITDAAFNAANAAILNDLLAQLQKQGKVRHFGVSNFNVEQLRAWRWFGDFNVSQPPYSLIDNGIEPGKQVGLTTCPYCQTPFDAAFRYCPSCGKQLAVIRLYNELLGEFVFSGINSGKAGEAQVEVTFDVNVEGILTMSALDPATGKKMKTTVRVTQS